MHHREFSNLVLTEYDEFGEEKGKETLDMEHIHRLEDQLQSPKGHHKVRAAVSAGLECLACVRLL